MEIEDVKPNSHKYKEEQKKKATEGEKRVEKIVKGQVKTKKKGELSKFAEIFISEDIKDVKSFIIKEIIIPAAKNTISDIFSKGTDMLLYGDTTLKKKSGGSNYISYRDFGRIDKRSSEKERTKSRFDYDEIIFESRGEAEMAISQLCDIIDRYGFATVADLYEMCELTSPYTANKYGWIGTAGIRNADVTMVRGGGYIIKLPKAAPID